MKFHINPGIGVNNIAFGMHFTQVRRAVGAAYKLFRRGSEPVESEFYISQDLMTYYGAGGKLEAIEFAPPAETVLFDTNLLALNWAEVSDFLRAHGGDVEDRGDGPILLKLGVGVWTPDAPYGPHAAVESVIVFAPGYYKRNPKA